MALSPETIRSLKNDPQRVLTALRDHGEASGHLAQPTASEAALLAIGGTWGWLESLAAVGPWVLVLLGLALFSLGSATVWLILACQAVAAVVATGAVLYRRYQRNS